MCYISSKAIIHASCLTFDPDDADRWRLREDAADERDIGVIKGCGYSNVS